MIPALAFRYRLLLAVLGAVLLVPATAASQVFTPPQGVGSVTLGWQWIDNTGHILTNGVPVDTRRSATTSVLVEVDYGMTDRFAATVAVPFVFARYTGDPSSAFPFPLPERDKCRCWNQSFQDLSIGGRYRFGGDFWGLTPQVRVIIPSHNYPYEGEAVVGSSLTQSLFGVSGFWRLAPVLSNATIHAGYTFALVEEAYEGLRTNRSNIFTSVGYALSGSLYVHGGALLQKTHGGLTGVEILKAPEDQQAQRDRLLKTRYVHLTGGLTYVVSPALDLFFSVQPYMWGRDAHDGIAYTAGATWNFVFPK